MASNYFGFNDHSIVSNML